MSNLDQHALAYLIAVLDQQGPTPVHPADLAAAQARALTVWEQDGAVWLKTGPRGDAA